MGKVGYYLPWAVASAVLSSIGYGLLSTLKPTSSTGSWIGYQIITGVGRGSGLQMVTFPANTESWSFTILANSSLFEGHHRSSEQRFPIQTVCRHGYPRLLSDIRRRDDPSILTDGLRQ